VTDISSKGSLPQVTDVLYLLTDSQELLLQRVQSMRTEIARSNPRVTEQAPSTVNASPSSNASSRVPVVPVSPSDGLTSSEPTAAERKTVYTRTLIDPPAENSQLVDSSPSITQSSSSRSYNFFDDLDALLAALEGPNTAS
jgi:hypothetical protein